MKTIIENSTNLSKYLLSDNVYIVSNTDNIVIGNPVQFVVSDLNATNSNIYENVTAPSDWNGNKYFFNGTDWILNPDWVDPSLEEQQ